MGVVIIHGWLQEAMLSRDLLVNIVLSAGIIVCGTLYVFKEMMEDGRMTARDTTMTFTCFVFFDMFNALSCRYDFFFS
jgi:Ca2+-transporting ATPase